MAKKILFIVLGVLCLVASGVMYSLRNDSHLSELVDFYWSPIPIGILLIVAGIRAKSK